MKVLCVIPARYASTRLPGKPLSMIAGKPMIQHVYERACQAELPDEVVVATDNELVEQAVLEFGGKAVMTSPDHPSGTDRLAEVALMYPDVDVIVNVQGDEPMIPAEVVDRLAAAFKDDEDLLKNLIEFQIANGTKAIVVLGTTGESSSITNEERVKIIKKIR